MEYDDMLVKYYNNNQRFLQKKLDPRIISETKIFEKTEIKWFSFDEMLKRKKEFRTFYQNIVELILNNRHEIELFVKTRYRNKKTQSRNKKTRSRNKKTRSRNN